MTKKSKQFYQKNLQKITQSGFHSRQKLFQHYLPIGGFGTHHSNSHFFFVLFQVGRFSWPRSSGNGSSRRQIQLNKFAKFAEYLLSNLLLHFSTSTSPFSTQVLRNLPQISTKMTCVFFPNLLYSLPQSLTLKKSLYCRLLLYYFRCVKKNICQNTPVINQSTTLQQLMSFLHIYFPPPT